MCAHTSVQFEILNLLKVGIELLKSWNFKLWNFATLKRWNFGTLLFATWLSHSDWTADLFGAPSAREMIFGSRWLHQKWSLIIPGSQNDASPVPRPLSTPTIPIPPSHYGRHSSLPASSPYHPLAPPSDSTELRWILGSWSSPCNCNGGN